MARDTVTGRNKKFTQHKNKVVEDVTEESLMAALAKGPAEKKEESIIQIFCLI
jgi:hypothetical protein